MIAASTASLLLAVDGPDLVGGSSVPILILVLALGGFALAYVLVGPGKRKGPKRYGDIPLASAPTTPTPSSKAPASSVRWRGASRSRCSRRCSCRSTG
jgi:hypothetical protein